MSEVTGLQRGDVALGVGAHVRCLGKGRKERCTPLTMTTAAVLRAWLREPARRNTATLFPSAQGGRLSRDSVADLLAKHVAARHPLSPLPLPPASRPDMAAGLPAITQALAATRHLMEMYRRQLTQPASRGTLDRLEHRLGKILAELGQLPDPAM